MQWRGVRRLSVRPSVCKLLRKSLLLAGKWLDRDQTCRRWSQVACIQGVLKIKVKVTKVKGHVIRVLFWNLGMSYSVVDGLV